MLHVSSLKVVLTFNIMVRLDIVYFAESWKYDSKIIFKCVNSVVRPIFNEKLLKSEVYESHKECTDPSICIVHGKKVKNG